MAGGPPRPAEVFRPRRLLRPDTDRQGETEVAGYAKLPPHAGGAWREGPTRSEQRLFSVVLAHYIVQPRLSELAGTRENVRIIERLGNRGCISTYAYTQGPSQRVQIIERSDNRAFG